MAVELPRVRLTRSYQKLLAGDPLTILAIGSSSTVGIGASSPDHTYPAQLKTALAKTFPNRTITMVKRGVSGQVAADMVARLKFEVAQHQPDLVIWQVGTNAAIARIPPQTLTELMGETFAWLRSHKIDIAVIDPQFTDRLAQDEHYVSVVEAIAKTARVASVLHIPRFETMQALAEASSARRYLSRDRFHLNNAGYKCLSEFAMRSIVSGILLADAAARTTADRSQ